MDQLYNYNVVINGLDRIPLRTTVEGARTLLKSFHDEPGMETLLLEAVDSGTPFKNKLVSVSVVGDLPPAKAPAKKKKAAASNKKGVRFLKTKTKPLRRK